tara:strand:+ start:3911 stop:4213 length:303 start_codon:yes stop_codon:yes gene_type:complete
MKITGKVKEIYKVQSGVSKKGNNWQKQGFLLDLEKNDFNSNLYVECFGDSINLINSLMNGQKVECEIEVSSREYNGKWYHNVNARSIEKIESVGEDNVPF